MKRSLPTGIFRTPHGYRVVVRVHHGAGGLKTKRYPASTGLQEMKQWRVDQRQAWRVLPADSRAIAPQAPATFAADAVTYLAAVKTMPSLKDRTRDIALWVTAFGDRPRTAITPVMIKAQRDQWLTVGPKRVLEKTKDGARWMEKPLPLSASTVNHRLRALENFFTVMNGKHGENPVREVDEADEPDPLPRGQTFALALEILNCMPDRTAPKKGGAHEPGSLSRVRFEAMLWTGLPPIQISRLTPEMVDWSVPAYLPPRRLKGRRSRRARQRQRRTRQPKPLLPQAVDALRRLFALKANKKFSQTSLERSVRRAIAAANLARAKTGLAPIPHLTVYELTRHTFGTETYRSSQNLQVVQELLDHSDPAMSQRYARAAINEHTVQAINAMAERHPVAGSKPQGRRRQAKAQTRPRRRAAS